jgi:hypothetical protein
MWYNTPFITPWLRVQVPPLPLASRDKMVKKWSVLARSGSAVVEHTTHHPWLRVQVLPLLLAPGDKMVKKWAVLASSSSTVVEYSSQHIMVEGSSPATADDHT